MKRFFYSKKSFAYFWGPVFVWALVIFSFSALPVAKTTEFYWWDFVLKKTAHLTEYFIFYILVYRAVKNSSVQIDKKIFILSLLILVFYALSDEYHQSFTPGREATIRDVIIDVIGGLIALWFLKYKLAKAAGRLLTWAKNWQIL